MISFLHIVKVTQKVRVRADPFNSENTLVKTVG